MSGHSKWETTKRQKAAVDAKRGAAFTKLGNMIAIAARGGTDPTMNPALAMAVEKAKRANMPAANIQRAIDRVADKNAAALEEIVYEAYGPGGIGIIIETATDNRNRTFPEVKSTLTKNGGTIAVFKPATIKNRIILMSRTLSTKRPRELLSIQDLILDGFPDVSLTV